MLRKFFLLLFFTLSIYFPHSQQGYNKQAWKNFYRKAEELYSSEAATDKTDSAALAYYRQAIRLLEKNHDADSILLDSYLKAGILSMSHDQSNQAIVFFGNAIRTKFANRLLSDSLLFKPYVYSGSIYYDLNNLDSAFWFYKEAEKILDQSPNVSESERLYNKLGALYYATGDYRKSITYFTKALSKLDDKHGQNIYFIVNYKSNIASALRKSGYADSAISIYKELLPYKINENELLNNIGAALLDEEKNTDAILYLKKISNESPSKYNQLAEAYLRLNDYENAGSYLSRAFFIYTKKGIPSHDFYYANTLRIAGKLAVKNNKMYDALRLYQQAIIQLKPDFTDTLIYSNPVSFISMSNSFALFDVLVAKAKAFAVWNEKELRHAVQTFDAALILAKQLELRYQSDEARLFLNDKVTPACMEAIDLVIELLKKNGNDSLVNKIFKWCEGNKSSVLQAGLYSLQFDSLSSLPPYLLKESKSKKALLAKLNLLASLQNESLARDIINKKMNDLEIQLSSIQGKLEEYPSYRRLLFSSRESPIDSVGKYISAPDEAIISFYHTQKYLIIFYITKETNGVVYTPFENNLIAKISRYRHELDAAEAGDRQLIGDLSSYLFNRLLQPVFQKIKSKKHLVIIPHNEISYLPFETLTNPATKEFVLNDFAVSYQYSANFLKEPSAEKNNSSYSLLAFAPFTGQKTSKNGSSVLYESRKEIESLNGKVLFDEQATKNNFTSLSPDFSVIHLATHAKANDSDPLQSYIEFYGSPDQNDTARKLYEQEIYNLNIKSAKLVILSACETGSGRLVNGEGIMSLSRAFSYAGCPAVVTSLWKAEDRATSLITQRMHKYLAEGNAIDEALQKAKKDYLQNTDIPNRYKQPAFWGHLILIGDYHPVYNSSKLWPWLVPARLIFVTFFIFFLYKKTNRRK